MDNLQTIDKAAYLYEVLGKYIPMDYNEDYYDFASKVVDKLSKGNPEDYFTAIQIMTDVSRNTLEVSEPADVLDLFIRALVEWRIIELVEFFQEIGYPND